MVRMERRNAALQVLRRAQQEHAHLQARADELARAYHDIQRKMRDSGEHGRRVAEYKQAWSEFYAKKNEAYRKSSLRQRREEPWWRVLLPLYLLLTPAVLLIFFGVVGALTGLLYWPLIVGILLFLGYWMMTRPSVQEREANRAYERYSQMREPPPTAYHLVGRGPDDRDLLTEEEAAALSAYRKAQHAADNAKQPVARAQQAYDIACMTPEEETAYWARKRYEIALEQRDHLARIELEVEMAQGQASEAAEEQKRLLADQTDELERLREEVRKLRDT